MITVLVATAPSTAAGIATAIATIITAVGGLILAVSVLIPILRSSRRTEAELVSNSQQLEQVHTIVNQQRTDQQRYNIALVELLKKNGIEVPIDQSLPVPGVADAHTGQPGLGK